MQARIEATANGVRDMADDIRRMTIDVGFQIAADQRLVTGILESDTPLKIPITV
ncbi:MAG: hypothetical protein FWC91_06100 [Defluviitaleaceae bacterium]|nr:hypothetical protein [Defluviitaleaceae bacterium]